MMSSSPLPLLLIPSPVGERKGTWWREVSLVRKKKKKKNQRSRDATGAAAVSDAEKQEAQDLAKDVVENATADVLVRIKSAKRQAKMALAKSRDVV
jgi:hypothetical protein